MQRKIVPSFKHVKLHATQQTDMDKSSFGALKNWVPYFFKKQGNISDEQTQESNSRDVSIFKPRNNANISVSGDLLSICDFGSPYIASTNFITLFESVPEVYFPIKYIIDRIVGAEFLLKRAKDDSIVWDNSEINKLLTNPNPVTSFSELIMAHFAYRYLTGDSFFMAAIPDSFTRKDELWKWCDNYWTLPSNHVSIITPQRIPLFSNADKTSIIDKYRLNANGTYMDINPLSILHSKDLNLNMDCNYLRGKSRLLSQMKPISNLIAVYEARNVIYVKRGALGLFVGKKMDETGSVALNPKEKKEIREEYQNTYGLSHDKSPIGIIPIATDFIRVNMSIQDLQPFEETLSDACQIAGAYGIPSVLIPRKDLSTFDNQKIAEKAVYTNTIIPETNKFVKELTSFLGLDKSGLYIDADFSNVDVLQEGFKERQQTKSITSTKCKQEFWSGIITLNDWRAQIGETRVINPLYDKLILDMNNEELDKVRNVLNINSNTKQYVTGGNA